METERAVDYYTAYRSALSLYSDGQYADAVPLFANLLDRNPGDASLWFRLGRSRAQLGRSAGAIEAYRTALDLGYRYTPWVAYRVARLFAELAQTDSSFVWLERALGQGYDNRPGIAGDPAFESLRDDPRFAPVAGQPPDRPLSDLSDYMHQDNLITPSWLGVHFYLPVADSS